MNVLIYFENTDVNEHYRSNAWALVPKELLAEYDLEAMNGMSSSRGDSIGENVSILLDRLGLMPYHPLLTEDDRKNWSKLTAPYVPPSYRTSKDLACYVDPTPPFTVDELVVLYA